MSYFVCKIIISIVLGIALSITFIKLGKRDPIDTQKSKQFFKYFILVAGLLIVSFCWGTAISFMYDGNTKYIDYNYVSDQVSKVIKSQRLDCITEDYYGLHSVNSQGFYNWKKYNEPLLRRMDDYDVEKWYEDILFQNRFGKDTYDKYKNNRGLRDKMYRDVTIEERVKELWSSDEHYDDLKSMSTQGKYELLLSDAMSNKELNEYQKKVDERIRADHNYTDRYRVYTDSLIQLGFILLSVVFYVFFFKKSTGSRFNKALKVIAYISLIAAYINSTDYHSAFEVSRVVVAYIGVLVFIIIGAGLIHLTRNKSV